MPEANEQPRGEAATRVEVPDTDYAALAASMLDDVQLPDDGGDQDGQEGQEGEEEELLTEGGGPAKEGDGDGAGTGEEGQEGALQEGEGQATAEAVPQPDMAKLRQAEVERLTGVYSFSDDDARTMTVEPEKVLPRKLAEMHANIVETVVAVLGAQLPGVVEALADGKRQRASTEDAFYKMFPALKKAEFRETVESSLRVAKQLDPKAPVQDVLRQAGIIASMKHRVPLPKELLGDAAGAASPEPTPQKPKRAGFVPASPGASAAGSTGKRRNEFEALADEFLDEDD